MRTVDLQLRLTFSDEVEAIFREEIARSVMCSIEHWLQHGTGYAPDAMSGYTQQVTLTLDRDGQSPLELTAHY